MAEETLYCPSCNQKVRVPEELLGQTVQCPLCRLVFTAPVRGGAPPVVLPVQPGQAVPPSVGSGAVPGPQPVYSQPAQPPIVDPYQRAAAESLLRTPGILMVMTGALGVVYNLVEAIRVRMGGPQEIGRQMQAQHEWLGMQPPPFLTPENSYVMILTLFCIFLVARLFMVFAGFQMLRGRGYGMAITGSILSLIPCLDCPCCLLCPPVALWSLIVLMRSDVRSIFQ